MKPSSSPRYSRRVADLHASPIREMLAVIDRPGMISFAGGLPAADSFPSLTPGAAPPGCLQYGASEGDGFLREQVAGELRALGLDCATEQVLIVSGSQQGLDLVAKLFIDEGTAVAVESPTYLAALQVFRFFGARFQSFSAARPEAIAEGGGKPAFAYAIPTFQNPSGHCYSRTERQALASVCDEAGIPLFEDDPYRDLAYDACERTPVSSLLKTAPWIYQGSFSKSLAPGLRLGYLAASPELMPLLVRLKQAADLHSNRISQWLVGEQLAAPTRGERLAALRAGYRKKRDLFDATLRRHFNGLADWQLPLGGLFFWLRLRRPVDTRTLLAEAISRGVIFMPGENFHADGGEGIGTLRLNFSLASEEEMEAGLARLAELFRRG
ncbi:aminotransferase-like domain-containing protein [Thauera sp. SDU_THAU2]|uniref:aminotransferase-like domain-containing protein n=1 Tax=Thauera sp. SDU_THAU2 TaxID=3136633 RepID=UPI00312053D5